MFICRFCARFKWSPVHLWIRAMGWCPLYHSFMFDTPPTEEK